MPETTIRPGRLQVAFESIGAEVVRPLVEVKPGAQVKATARIETIRRSGPRAIVSLAGADDATGIGLLNDVDLVAAHAHQLQVGNTITIRGNAQRLGSDGTGMPVIAIYSIAS